LSIDGIKLLLKQVPTETRQGRRDLALLALLYDSGARAQELADLTLACLRFESPCTIRILGKGKKQRIVPLQKEEVDLLKNYIYDFKLDTVEKHMRPLFFSRVGDKLTTAGISYIVKKYANAARIINSDVIPDVVSPHILRHSKAMHLLQSGVNIIYIRDFLGHKSIQTTEVYARADSKQKREALESVYINILPQQTGEGAWEKNSTLKNFLKNLG
jgi:site-specific recombinase XerD